MAEEKQHKIIIVDDDDFLVNMYATKFGNSGVSADACKSGKEFLEKLGGEAAIADLVLLDIVMPDINGIDLLKEIRKSPANSKVPVIMLTNQNDEKDISEAQKYGIEGYIIKSAATPSEVVAEVMKVLKNS